MKTLIECLEDVLKSKTASSETKYQATKALKQIRGH